MLTRDLSRREIGILFDLSNGKRLFVLEDTSEAWVADPQTGTDTATRFVVPIGSVRILRKEDCLVRQAFGDLDVYTISDEGVERLLDSSIRPGFDSGE
jgi:hypothetical protein